LTPSMSPLGSWTPFIVTGLGGVMWCDACWVVVLV